MSVFRMHGWIAGELANLRTVAESMLRLIDECASERPHSDWERFRALPFGDLAPVVDWLRTPFEQEPSARPLKALWFGLFNPCYGDGEPVADFYVCGSERFDPNPYNNSWAVNPEWWPAARCARSEILADIYRIAYRESDLGNDAEYPLCLGYGAFAVQEALARIEPSLTLGGSHSLGIAVGFDSGDFILLGELGPEGMRAGVRG